MKHDKPNLSGENIANLNKLADYLLSGNLKADFTMVRYSSSPITFENCGTAGCAIGHGPYAGIPNTPLRGWLEYSRVFIPENKGGIFAKAWQWCFAYDWCGTDNTPEGAGKRIKYMLEHGVPEDSVDQMFRKHKLCY